jgi:hypothetical protein
VIPMTRPKSLDLFYNAVPHDVGYMSGWWDQKDEVLRRHKRTGLVFEGKRAEGGVVGRGDAMSGLFEWRPSTLEALEAVGSGS